MKHLLTGLKVLADEKRLEIIKLLAAGDYCVGCLAERLEITPSAVSQHLKILRQAGFVRGDKRGYWTHYQLEVPRLQEWLTAFHHWTETLAQEAKEPCSHRGYCKGRHQ